MTQKERDSLRGVSVTLDGCPAVIQGFKNPFGTIAALPDGPEVQWSWGAIRRIVAAGGHFTS